MSSLVLTADTLLGTPTIGSTEFDGKAFYATPQGTQRGVIPGAQFYRLNADLVGTTASTAQNLFGVGVTLSASTVYAFEIEVGMVKTAGATSHTISLSFAGSATLNNTFYTAAVMFDNSATALKTNASQNLGYVSTAAATILTQALASSSTVAAMLIKGTVSINGGGTFTPQYTQGSTGAYSTVAGSYINIYPIGTSGANISVGAWA
jgi:hypothetical protein